MPDCPVDCPDCLEARYFDHGAPVLDHGFVRIQQSNLSDEMVVRAAKVSFANDDLSEVDFDRFIGFLMRNRHGTPFEHGSVTFHIEIPIFVAREWWRHRMASINEMSGRYTELKPKWYVPSRDDIRHQVGKPGSYSFETVEDNEFAEHVRKSIDDHSRHAFAHYSNLLDQGIAKEIARLVLPVNTYTMAYWTVNARGLMNWLSLRNAPDAQREIRYYAEVIEEMFQHLMPATARAFVSNGRVAP